MTDQTDTDAERVTIREKLDAAGIEYDARLSTPKLAALLPASPPEPPSVVAPAPSPGVPPPILGRRKAARVVEPSVICEVTKNGDGNVHTGGWDIDTNSAETFEKGDQFSVAKSIADALEDRGFVVIRG